MFRTPLRSRGKPGFKSLSRYQLRDREVWSSHKAHNLEIGGSNPSLASKRSVSPSKFATYLTAQVSIEPGVIVVMTTYSGGLQSPAGKIRRTGLALLPRQLEASMVIGERLFTPLCRLGIVATSDGVESPSSGKASCRGRRNSSRLQSHLTTISV